METINTTTILDRGAKFLGNHPDDLVRRITLAQILVDTRAVRSIEAGIQAFRMWASPESRQYPVETVLRAANERIHPRGNVLHE